MGTKQREDSLKNGPGDRVGWKCKTYESDVIVFVELVIDEGSLLTGDGCEVVVSARRNHSPGDVLLITFLKHLLSFIAIEFKVNENWQLIVSSACLSMN